MPTESRWRRLWRRLVRYRVLVYLLLLLFAADWLVASRAAVWRAYNPVFYRDRLDVCRARTWDVVVVGGSPVMYGIDADVLAGVRYRREVLEGAFNLGLPL